MIQGFVQSRPPRALLKRVSAFAYFAGLVVLLVSGGGLFCLSVLETPAPGTADSDALHRMRAAVTVAAAGAVVIIAGTWLRRHDRRTFSFGTVLLLMLTGVTLFACELVARFSVPPWPALGLHGVHKEIAARAWSKPGEDGGVGYNAWGQRDLPRTLKPAAGSDRIAFVGDSFLEESAGAPVSLRVEQKIDRADLEVLNLGVSATGPDEYFYRVKNIALPLGARHCAVFLFAGNDFVEPSRSLETFLGIAAVYPRDSLLFTLGLQGLNHLLTNSRRPVLMTWFAAGDLHAHEQRRAGLLAQADDFTIRSYLLAASNTSRQARAKLAARLDGPNIASFYQMLRNPDAGRFRSYYLSAALWSVSAGDGQWDPNPEQYAYGWVSRIAALCRDRGIGLTVVVVPEAFQVDSRMCEQWKPLADMRHLTQPCRDASARFCRRLTADGVELIDLHDVFQDVPGTYLNVDGHWSQKGVELASDAIASKLSELRD